MSGSKFADKRVFQFWGEGIYMTKTKIEILSTWPCREPLQSIDTLDILLQYEVAPSRPTSCARLCCSTETQTDQVALSSNSKGRAFGRIIFSPYHWLGSQE